MDEAIEKVTSKKPRHHSRLVPPISDVQDTESPAPGPEPISEDQSAESSSSQSNQSEDENSAASEGSEDQPPASAPNPIQLENSENSEASSDGENDPSEGQEPSNSHEEQENSGEQPSEDSSDDIPPVFNPAIVPASAKPQSKSPSQADSKAPKRKSSSPDNDSKRQKFEEALICAICAEECVYPAVICPDHRCQKFCCMRHYAEWGQAKNGSTARLPCMFCKRIMEEFVYHKFVNEIVGERIIECPKGCGETARADEMETHCDKYCENREVFCPQAKFGCKWKGTEEARKTHVATCDFEQRSKALQTHNERISNLKAEIAEIETIKRRLAYETRQIEEHFRNSVEESLDLLVAKRTFILENPKPRVHRKARRKDTMREILSYSHAGQSMSDDKLPFCNDSTPIMTIDVDVAPEAPHYYKLWGYFTNQQSFPQTVSGIITNVDQDLPYPVPAVNLFSFRFSRNGEKMLLYDEQLCYDTRSLPANAAAPSSATVLNPFANLDVDIDSVEELPVEKKLPQIAFSMSLFLMRKA